MNSIESFASGRFPFGRKGKAAGVPAGVLLALAALVLSACAGSPAAGRGAHAPSAADVALVRFTSCDDALQNLRAAAASAVAASSSSGTTGPAAPNQAAPNQAAPRAVSGAAGSVSAGAAGQPGATAPGSYSGTNTATPGVDEPDLVKTDGRRRHDQRRSAARHRRPDAPAHRGHRPVVRRAVCRLDSSEPAGIRQSRPGALQPEALRDRRRG